MHLGYRRDRNEFELLEGVPVFVQQCVVSVTGD